MSAIGGFLQRLKTSFDNDAQFLSLAHWTAVIGSVVCAIPLISLNMRFLAYKLVLFSAAASGIKQFFKTAGVPLSFGIVTI